MPVGNGRLGAMVLAGSSRSTSNSTKTACGWATRSSWADTSPFGDLFVEFVTATAEKYRRELNLHDAVHTVTYTADGVTYRREVFSGFPDQGLVDADDRQPAGFAFTGSVRLTNAPQGRRDGHWRPG